MAKTFDEFMDEIANNIKIGYEFDIDIDLTKGYRLSDGSICGCVRKYRIADQFEFNERDICFDNLFEFNDEENDFQSSLDYFVKRVNEKLDQKIPKIKIVKKIEMGKSYKPYIVLIKKD